MTTITKTTGALPTVTITKEEYPDWGDYVGSVPFTLAASDSFDRANGGLGSTDGAGTDGVTGGSGKVWTAQWGTWAIATNTARATALDGGSAFAIATIDTGETDGVIMSKANAVSSLTVAHVVRFVDVDNQVQVRMNQAGAWNVRQIIGGGSGSVLLSGSGVSWVQGAELITRLDGLRLSIEYNGEYLGSIEINVAFASSTIFGMLLNAASSVVNFEEWHFIKLPVYESRNGASVVKANVGEYLITTPMIGDLTRCAEWAMRQEKLTVAGYAFTSNVRRIYDLSLVTVSTGAKEVLQSGGNGWESAQTIGADADVVGDYGFFGTVHQSEQSQSFAISATTHTISRWNRYYSPVTILQTINTIYPADKATTIGTTTLQHLFTSTGLWLTRSHTYEAGYKLYSAYGAMMPFNTAASVIDRYQVGTEDAAAIAADGATKNLGTLATIFRAWLDGGDFTLVMQLPTGGPENTLGYTNAPDYAGWMSDNATTPQKFYANYVDTTFGDRITAATSAHTVRYYIENGTP